MNSAKVRKILIVGAGFSGICAAIRLRQSGETDFTVIERAGDLGGVWHFNRYPGAACDVASSLYSFSFVDDYEWPRSHGTSQEIVDYIDHCVDRFGIRGHLQFDTEASNARWNDHDRTWSVETSRGAFEAKYLITGCGLFNKPSIPALPGLSSFVGPAFHSAKWDHGFAAQDKKIAVIGTGCSAAQFVPELVDEAAELIIFQRSACHVMPKAERTYTEEERALYRSYPVLRWVERALIEASAENGGRFVSDEGMRDGFTAQLLQSMAAQISDAGKREKLLPKFPVGAKRPIASDTFLPALDRANVTIVSDRIDHVTPSGIATADGAMFEVDAIVFGTGFAASDYLLPLQVEGRDGRDIQQVWRDGAYAYLGMLVDGFPNLLMIYGPNSNVIGSILQIIEPQVEFIVSLIAAAEREGALAEINEADVRDYNEKLQERLAQCIYGAGAANNYFAAASGKIVTQFSGTPHEFAEAVMAKPEGDFLVTA